jgi:hypothetical protein
MIEMEEHSRSAVLAFRSNAVGLAAKHEARQKAGTFLAVTNLRKRRPHVRKVHLNAGIENANVEIEFIKARLDDNLPFAQKVCGNRVDELDRSVGGALYRSGMCPG